MKLARMPDGSPEIFHTLQGEGRQAGLPCVFIRSSLCNLHCRWCDTDYTWNWVGTPFAHDRDKEPGYAKYRREELIVEIEVAEVVEAAAAFGCANFVFTGGEPLLHESDWIAVMNGLDQSLNQTCHFEVETNGTRLPGAEFLGKISRLNVSPKLANANVARDQRIKPQVLRALAASGKADFKFVVENETDLAEVDALVTEAGMPRENVFLMSQGTNEERLRSRTDWVVAQCLARGYRYSDRLHLRLFGSRRGV